MPFFRREPIRPVFVTPPAESRDLAAVEDEIEHLDRQLLHYAHIPRPSRKWTWTSGVDRILDLRLALRQAGPDEVPEPGPDHDVYAEDIR